MSETIDNLLLIENGLKHVLSELGSMEISYFRIARESHEVFYRVMIERLKGSANLGIVVDSPGKATKKCIYQNGSDPIKRVKKQTVSKCKKMWRYSVPVIHEEGFPDISCETEEEKGNYLIKFENALAMIQSEAFMRTWVDGKEIEITDEELQEFDYLHEHVRNEYEHFIPKSKTESISKLIDLSKLCISKSFQTLYESGMPVGEDSFRIKKHFQRIIETLDANKEVRVNFYSLRD